MDLCLMTALVSGRVGIPSTGLTTLMAVVTPTDRPKLIRNRCVIEVFSSLFVLSRCFLDLLVGVGASVIAISQISYFFSYSNVNKFIPI